MAEKGIFGGMFDFDGDGELDAFERAAEFGFLQELMDEDDDDDNDDFYDNLDDDFDDEDDDDFDGDDWD